MRIISMHFAGRVLPIIAVAIAAIASGRVSLADEPKSTAPAPAPTKKSDSLDDQLFKSLDNQLLDGLDDASLKPSAKKVIPPTSKPDDKQPGDDGKTVKPHPDNVTSPDEEGEDIGEASSRDPLKKIERAMRAAGERIGQTKAQQPATKLQQQAIDELEQLIAQLQQQKQQQQSSSSSSSNSNQQKQQKPGNGGKSGDPTKSTAPADKPANDSSNKLQQRKEGEVDRVNIQSLANDLWIRLPDKAREKIKQSQDEQFLPKYQSLVEKYFRRLVEDDDDRSK